MTFSIDQKLQDRRALLGMTLQYLEFSFAHNETKLPVLLRGGGA